MPVHYLQTSSSLSREDSPRNEAYLTPYPTVPEPRDCSPSAIGTWDNLVHTAEPEAKQTHFYASSASGLCHSSPTPSLNILSTELQRVLDSLLDQVDWLEVAIKVAKSRAPSIYCQAIEQILLAQIYQLVKAEGGDDSVGFKNGNDEKDYTHEYEGDDEDEDKDSSEFVRQSEDEDGDYDEDGDNDRHIEEDKDDDDVEVDRIDEDESGEDSECDGV
ncbi:hypothetical protein N7G274_006846 [Stereocaulon virgatum]|uniref:Uncharacterized protein n=1 Tax=Stereocaulon virgatum TaxID=373712 RepID=A0ABR4AAM3_9LECA